jgi:hypothetical protein
MRWVGRGAWWLATAIGTGLLVGLVTVIALLYLDPGSMTQACSSSGLTYFHSSVATLCTPFPWGNWVAIALTAIGTVVMAGVLVIRYRRRTAGQRCRFRLIVARQMS